MDSSILIRTLLATEDRIVAQAGGGIVADSDPALEYEETLVKIFQYLNKFENSFSCLIFIFVCLKKMYYDQNRQYGCKYLYRNDP